MASRDGQIREKLIKVIGHVGDKHHSFCEDCIENLEESLALLKEKPKENNHKIMAEAIRDYMKERGWEIIVLGKIEVRHYPSELNYNYELVIRFTGKPQPQP